MQRLFLSKLSTFTSKSSSLFHFRPHKTLSLLTKPLQTQKRLLSFFSTNPLHHHHNFTQKIHAFLRRQSLLKLSSTNRVAFLQTKFPKQCHNSHHSARSSWLNWVSSDDLVCDLILANVVVYCLWQWVEFDIVPLSFMFDNFTISFENLCHGRLHTLITSAFSQVEFQQMVFDMIGLYVFGRNIGRVFGAEFLLKLYLAGAIGGSFVYLEQQALIHLITSSERSEDVMKRFLGPGLGANGAVNAIMLLDIFLHPRVPLMLLGIFLIGKDLKLIMEVPTEKRSVSGSIHWGGAIVAAIAWARLRLGLRFF